MRILACILLLSSATEPVLAQTQWPPAVRDAFVLKGDPRVVSLQDDLITVACEAEYQAWLKGQKPPLLSLFLNGMLMKGPEAVTPAPASATDGQLRNVKDSVKEDCARQADIIASVARKEADEKAVAAKVEADKAAVEEPDATKKAALKVASDTAAVAAKDAAAKAAMLESAGRPVYVKMHYYLDPQFVTKEESKQSWIRLLAPMRSGGSVTVSVGPADSSAWLSTAALQFERINVRWLIGWSALFLAAIILFVRYARRSNIIREPGELPVPPGAPARMKAYSLARTQMAVWTFLVAGALVFLFLVTWNENTISSGVLVLLGISFGTTLMAASADRTVPSKDDVNLAEQKAAAKAAAAKDATAKAVAETLPDKKAIAEKVSADRDLDAKDAAAKLEAFKAGVSLVPRPSKDFLTDLLTEEDGPSFHRYQMVLFTVILAVIFVAKTAATLVMPEFDTTLLGLMGISSGTYLGSKLLKI